MSQCYTIYLRGKVRNPQKFMELSTNAIKKADVAPQCVALGDFNTPDGHIRFMLADHQHGLTMKEEPEGWREYRSEFTATYSWWEVLADWFMKVAPALEDGSDFEMTGDDPDYTLMLEVAEGEAA